MSLSVWTSRSGHCSPAGTYIIIVKHVFLVYFNCFLYYYIDIVILYILTCKLIPDLYLLLFIHVTP